MRTSMFALFVGAVSMSKELSTAFHCPKAQFSHRLSSRYISTKLAVASKPPRGGKTRENKSQDGWENFKQSVYNVVDSVGDLTSKLSDNQENSRKGVSDGYRTFEQIIKNQGTAPGSRLMAEYEARASTLGVDKSGSSKKPSKVRARSSFETFKDYLYAASDTFGSMYTDSPKQTPLAKLERSIPFKESLAKELGVASEKVEDLLSDNPVTRFQAQQEIRQREARKRAEVQNKRIRANKEDVYKIVDAMQAAVDAFPDTIDQTEKTIKQAIKSVKGVPSKVEKVVDDVKSIPLSVKVKADQTTQSVAGTIEKTKKVVEEVIDIPKIMTKKVADTTKAAFETKKSIADGVTDMKVVMRLEKPQPKPPKLPPPTSMTAQDFALKMAGSVASGAGKVTWWATKNFASAAWNGAQSALEKGQTKLPARASKTLSTPFTSQRTASLPKSASTQTQSKADEQMAELQQEVAEALRLAEESLRDSDA